MNERTSNDHKHSLCALYSVRATLSAFACNNFHNEKLWPLGSCWRCGAIFDVCTKCPFEPELSPSYIFVYSRLKTVVHLWNTHLMRPVSITRILLWLCFNDFETLLPWNTVLMIYSIYIFCCCCFSLHSFSMRMTFMIFDRMIKYYKKYSHRIQRIFQLIYCSF